MTCGNALLQKVYETGFALDEVTLYLDTHPSDSQAMEYYKCQHLDLGQQPLALGRRYVICGDMKNVCNIR